MHLSSAELQHLRVRSTNRAQVPQNKKRFTTCVFLYHIVQHVGYRACLELLQSDAFCKVPVAAHATKLQVVFSQDSSTKVRRAGFRAWLCLQELCQGSYDCNDWDIEALQVVKARCLDRSVSSLL